MGRPTNEQRASGLCYLCWSARRQPARGHCLDCIRKIRARIRDYRRQRDTRRKANGVCTKCAKPAMPGKSHCARCLATRRKRTRMLVRKGLCLQCRQPAGEMKYCRPCLLKFGNRHKAFALRLKLEVFERYGGAHCECCGEANEVFLTVDHIGGGGAKHRREVLRGKGGEALYRWLKKNGFPEGYRVLCFNCNFAYHRLGCCPHQEKQCETSDRPRRSSSS